MEQARLEELIAGSRDRVSIYLLCEELYSLPESIGNLTNLTKLHLRANELRRLPESIGNLTNLIYLDLDGNRLTYLPESIGNLTNLIYLDLDGNRLTYLPESIGNLTNLIELNLNNNQLTCLPKSINNLANLTSLHLNNNQLTSLPSNLVKIKNLDWISIGNNPLIDLSLLKKIPKLRTVYFLNVELPSRYWCKLSDWEPNWLLDERNVTIRSILIEHVGYEKICDELNAITLDTWREYTLLKIDGVENTYGLKGVPIASEPMVLLKMTCPSTAHIHILRVPPEMISAEAAIAWVNNGIHPDKFSVQT